MMERSSKYSVRWIVSSFGLFFILFIGCTSANKEGYYGKYVGKLSQLHHGVSGDVFAVDARTLHIRNFNYDGEGPAAYFYAGSSKAPGSNGFRVRDERGTTNVLPRYRNKHITITLPEGKNLQNIRWFSVWCDEFSVNFGDVKIPKNLDFPKPQKISGLSGVHGVSSEPIVIVDAQTLLIPSFSYDGEAPDAKFWVGRGFKPSPQGIRIPDENGKELPLRRYDRKTIVLTLPGDLTIFDIGHFGVWCEAFTVDFGHVQIPRGLNIPPSLKMLGVSPQSKLNCEVLWDDFAYEVRWAVAGDSIVLQLVARLENNEYMSFGLSGDESRSRMVGGDVVVAWVDKESLKGYAKDYYLDAKSQCSGGRGSCPDENIQAGAESVRLLNAALVNGYSIVTFQRSLRAQDDLDRDVLTNSSQPIIWAVGPLNSRKEVSYHSLANRGDIFIDFGRAPKWNCPTPESTSDEPSQEDPSLDREYEKPKIEDSSRREFVPKSEIPTPAPAPKTAAWVIPPIKCNEPEDGVFYAQMGPTGGKRGYSAITGHVGWGISWYINGLLIPEIHVVRGRTYTFIVEGGLDPETPARYHPFYITDDPVGGYQYKTPQERANIQIFAGAVQNKRGEVRPTGVGRLCNWTPDPNAPPADEFASFGAYQRTLRLECDPGNPGIIQWTVGKDTPDTVYYQCYSHRYLGWKISVHDHCEGEAASDLVPTRVKAPAALVKAHEEADFEGSESINYETRVKPDADFLKSISAKNQTKFGPNDIEGLGATFFNAELSKERIKGLKNEFGPNTGIVKHKVVPQASVHHLGYPQVGIFLQEENLKVPQPSFVPENKLVAFSTVTLPPKSSGYSVTEEPLEGNVHQNFQIIPMSSFPSQGQSVRGSENQQKLVQGELIILPEQTEQLKNFAVIKAHPEDKSKKSNLKVPHRGRPSSSRPLGGPDRPKKPLPSNAFASHQRPFPPAAFRPPPFSLKSQKPSSHVSGHHVKTKSPHPHHRVNVALSPEHFNRQETQFRQHDKLYSKSPSFGPQDLFGSSTVNGDVPFARNGGFDPQSVQVEGGFKPILNTGIAPKSILKIIDRAALVEAEEEDGVGVINLASDGEEDVVTGKRPEAKETEALSERHKDIKATLFKNQKPQAFEPIFIPSRPDDGVKKYQEKYKKKPALTLKPRRDHFEEEDSSWGGQLPELQNSGEVSVSIGITRRRGMTHKGSRPSDGYDEKAPGVQQKETETHPRAQNIMEVIESQGAPNDESEAKASPSAPKDEELTLEDEIAMADEKKDFYLPPKAHQFLSYDGKPVKAVEAPELPASAPPTDLSKLPQFVPFKGAIPPLTQTVNAKNLPQLRTSKLARHDILPPSEDEPSGAFSRGRSKRSPDHVPGHEGHHHHHDHGKAPSRAGALLRSSPLSVFIFVLLSSQTLFHPFFSCFF